MIRATLLAALVLSLCACGSSNQQTRKSRPAKAAPAPPPDDAFASFEGKTASLGEQVTMHREPVGIAEARAVVALGKTEWVIMPTASGGEDKTATASLVVQRGEAAQNVRIEAGETGAALGLTITVHEAGEVYEEASMRWVQFAKVTFSLAP